ncbi:MAG TPA: uracil-DNA glycosylase [Streptosporangiaceae bacterium]|nr:uracil-DNA glycosylase [Streptosporangiaceae bacterium]
MSGPERGGPVRGPVPPGSGWPGDLATAATPVAVDARSVGELARSATALDELTARQSVCRSCPRLVAWREDVAVERRRAFADQQYWGRPIPGWGASDPRIVIVGLAPAAHGGNRTGRIFTGDRSGDFLFASLWRCGLAVQPTSEAAGDGQRLIGTRVLAAVKCAPPQNKPTISERDTCEPWLAAEFRLVAANLRVVVCLGHYAWQAAWKEVAGFKGRPPGPRPVFGHGVEVELDDLLVLGCYHPSQQNTFTGKVTGPMLDAVFGRAVSYADALK